MKESEVSRQIEKTIKAGRRTALKSQRKKVMMTVWVEEELRTACTKKTNVSEFLRRCLVRLSQSDLDKQVASIEDKLIKDTLNEVRQELPIVSQSFTETEAKSEVSTPHEAENPASDNEY